MKIDTNPIGNYTPINFRSVNPQQRVIKAPAQESAQTTVQAKQAVLTPEEKTFFANLYPSNKSEVVDYHFYEKSGKLSGVKIGSLIDRRG
jgi:hypothetical protein